MPIHNVRHQLGTNPESLRDRFPLFSCLRCRANSNTTIINARMGRSRVRDFAQYLFRPRLLDLQVGKGTREKVEHVTLIGNDEDVPKRPVGLLLLRSDCPVSKSATHGFKYRPITVREGDANTLDFGFGNVPFAVSEGSKVSGKDFVRPVIHRTSIQLRPVAVPVATWIARRIVAVEAGAV